MKDKKLGRNFPEEGTPVGGQPEQGGHPHQRADPALVPGPCGLRELTSTKWIVIGNGQIRE